MIASRKPRGAKLWVLFTMEMLLCLFAGGAFAGWWGNFILGEVALVVSFVLLRPLLVLGRRAAGAGADRPGGLQAAKRPKRGLRTVGIALVVVGLVLLAAGFLSHSGSEAVPGFGLASVIAGILCVWNSFDRVPSPGTTTAVKRFNRIMRIIGIALVPLMAFSTLALFLDAAHGHHEAWPLYTFVAVGLVSGLVWSYLVARAYGKWLRR